MENVIIAPFMTLFFLRLQKDEFVASTVLKSTFIYIGIALLAYVGMLNIYLCAVINFITPFIIIYLFLDEFDPTNQIPHVLAFSFFQMIPVEIKDLPIRIGAIVGACIITYCMVLVTRMMTKTGSNHTLQKLTLQGIQEMICQLDAVIQKNYDRVSEHQIILFNISRDLSKYIYGAHDTLVFNRSNSQHYFPFIIIFQHMNHLIDDICKNPKQLTQDTLLYLEKLKNILSDTYKLTQINAMEQVAVKLIELADETEIEQVDINYNLVYLLNYMSTALMDLPYKRQVCSFKSLCSQSHIWYYLKSNFNIHSFRMRFALRLSIAVCPITTLVYFFNLPKGFWISMTVMVVILPYWENTLRKIIDRVIGTLVGVTLFAILYYLFPNSIEQMIIMVIVNYFIYMTRRYMFTVIFLTCSSLSINVAVLGADHLFTLRIIYTLGAALIAVIVSFFVLPTNHATELKNMMCRLLDIDDRLLDLLQQLFQNTGRQQNKRDMVLTSYLVSERIENHCMMAKSCSHIYIRKLVILNNKFITDIAHIHTLMSMQQKERIDEVSFKALLLELKTTIKVMKDMLSDKKYSKLYPELHYHQIYDDVYINGKIIRIAECLYQMYDYVHLHINNN